MMRLRLALFSLCAGISVGAAYLLVRLVERLCSGPVDPGAVVAESWVRLHGRIELALWIGLPLGWWMAGVLARPSGEDVAQAGGRAGRWVWLLAIVAPLLAWWVP